MPILKYFELVKVQKSISMAKEKSGNIENESQ